jgi:hypothetical protein
MVPSSLRIPTPVNARLRPSNAAIVDCVARRQGEASMIGLATLMLFSAALQDRRALVPGGEDSDVATIESRSCGTEPEEIVVCGDNDPNRYRLPRVEPHYVEPSVRARTKLGPGQLSVEAEQRSFPGAEAPAAMVRFRMPLGRKKPK